MNNLILKKLIADMDNKFENFIIVGKHEKRFFTEFNDSYFSIEATKKGFLIVLLNTFTYTEINNIGNIEELEKKIINFMKYGN
ncbi:hypothetical protein P5F43_15210 [Clostridium perfringens]|uniref:hypothetical protein n=1 Tax=Clostridium TaxID=1485 RepID=UPI0018E4941A|nr:MULTISPECIES: hypothetical protein [Clostridium]MBI6111835.1 hypothetical protein [Clostridium perfringens]MBI6114890.1 hypothetical protein [Clostridium perfringens]MDK0888330.1 hypothetical protein [Clostridium perfringens]